MVWFAEGANDGSPLADRPFGRVAAANNYRADCNIHPNTAMQTYNPAKAAFADFYAVEKIGTLQGWAPTAPDEDFITGLAPDNVSRLTTNCISTVYSADLFAAYAGAEIAVQAKLYSWLAGSIGRTVEVGLRPDDDGPGFTLTLHSSFSGESVEGSGATLVEALAGAIGELP